MRKMLAVIAVALSAVSFVQAKVRMPQILSDNMVLQNNAEVNLWGTADPESKVVIKSSWGESVSVKASSDGKWMARLKTEDATFEPQTVTVSQGNKMTISNILIGEVWFCGGQSNMEMPVNGFANCPVEGSNEAIAFAGLSKGIRLASVQRNGTLMPDDDVDVQWKECSPNSVRWFSAVGFFFARTLQKALEVPVGVINCSWGGTRIEAWLPEDVLSEYPDVNVQEEMRKCKTGPKDSDWDYSAPLAMCNGMYHPVRNFTVNGVLWYQGCSNTGSYASYPDRFKSLANLYRANQERDDLDVFLVEIAPFDYDWDDITSALFREAQHRIPGLVPHTGIVCTNDLVYPDEKTQIHPRRKREVGERLAWLALNRTYGIKDIKCDYPCYKEMKVSGDKAEIFLDNAQDGLSPWSGMEGFEIAGEDKVFHPAKAWLNVSKSTIMVQSDEVSHPVAVRYCFKDFQIGNVIDCQEMPLLPFRTDDW